VALEKRDGNLYYYRSVRRGGQVRRVYMGSGELARIAHERDVMNQAVEDERRQEERRSLEELEALASVVRELDEGAEVLTSSCLVAAGYHRHKGEWRLRRGQHG
jgi:hypothetical protein